MRLCRIAPLLALTLKRQKSGQASFTHRDYYSLLLGMILDVRGSDYQGESMKGFVIVRFLIA